MLGQPVVATIDDLWPWWLARIVAPHDSALAALFTRRFFGVDSASYYLAGAELAVQAGASGRARAYYDSVRVLLEGGRLRLPHPAIGHSLLGVAYAGLGRRGPALSEARRATELLPVARDALWGTAVKQKLALVYARLGDAENAVRTLTELLEAPGILTPALLRVDPAWDRLRGDIRFRRLAEAE
jgi:tetratricopeptide (TPR) repeat protein